MSFISQTDKEYFSDRTRLSSSAIKTLLKSPSAFYNEFIMGVSIVPSSAMSLGTALHAKFLLNKDPAIIPKFDLRTNSGKYQRDEFEANKENGITYINEDEYNRLIGMERSLIIFKPLFTGELEKALHFEIEGVPFKAKIDCYNHKTKKIYDLKTTRDSTREGFLKSVIHFGYDIQAYIYMEALKFNNIPCEGFEFVVVESDAPFTTNSFKLDDSFLKEAEYKVTKALSIYKECVANKCWTNSEELKLPHWLKKNEKENLEWEM